MTLRMIRGALIYAITAFLLLAETTHAQTAPEFAAIEARMREIVAAREAPSVAAAAFQSGQVTWLHAEGWADIEAGVRATPDTIYRIGSVSKSITATAIMLAGPGAADLSEQVCIPTMAARRLRCSGIALADTLNMSAGMPQAVYYPGITDDPMPLTAEEFLHAYGFSVTGANDAYNYSNMGPALAARAVEQSLGEPFSSYARRALLAPLGMSATFYAMRDAPSAARAVSYNRRLNRFEREYETEPSVAAGMVSSVRDLTSFALLHIGSGKPALLSREQLETLHTPATAGFYGFGWGRISHGGRTFLISDGQVNGGQAIIIIEPARGVGAIVVANAAADSVNELALIVLDVLEPGAMEAFAQGATEAEARITQLPPSLSLGAQRSFQGALYVDGRALPMSLAAHGDRLEVRLHRSQAVQATSIEPENGYARWSLPCPGALPACVGEAEATLSLTRAPQGLLGMVTVTSLRGQFPYGLLVE